MPSVLRTVIPRIKRSLRERGVRASLIRTLWVPLQLLREHGLARRMKADEERSAFDTHYAVETDGEYDDRTYLSDLQIASPNWINGIDYIPIHPDRLTGILRLLPLRLEGFTFVDFGSGKGRALLVASMFPFRRIVGVEFAPALHSIAEENVKRFSSPEQRCRDIQCVCSDIVDYPLPSEPLVLFLFDPCEAPVLAIVLRNLQASLESHPREVWIAYAAPKHRHLMDSAGFIQHIRTDENLQTAIYANRAGGPT